ncbi:hypothetical protein BU16DRAFT_567372 [Lophium mytilinum]|uniref:F-box domain-containing protein n=1 Tax=Lophium mytilinum TaxID=390894 RepID=A0A6A6QC14_9PEZI|nr:hypothetical protein BU16DRAFT_567372 [Lophium mytilinum]
MNKPEASLLGCPAEILLEIARYLQDDTVTLKSLRRCRKKLRAIVDSVVFEEVHLAFVHPSLDWFMKIAQDPDLAPLVKRLVFHGQKPFDYVGFKEWTVAVKKDGYQLGDSELESYYQTYTEYAALESRFLPSRASSAVHATDAARKLDSAVQKLIQLQGISIIAYNEADDSSPFWERYEQDILLTPNTWRRQPMGIFIPDMEMDHMIWRQAPKTFELRHRTEGYVRVITLLRTLANSPPATPLQYLELTTNGWEFWVAPITARLHTVFSALTVLRLTTWEGERCAAQVGACISASSSLKELAFTCKGFGPTGQKYMHGHEECELWEAQDVLMTVKEWPALRKLILEVNTSQLALLKCLRTLAQSLESLTLRNVSLRAPVTPDALHLNLLCGSCLLSQFLCLKKVSFTRLSVAYQEKPTPPDYEEKALPIYREFSHPAYAEYVTGYMVGKKGSEEGFIVVQEEFLNSWRFKEILAEKGLLAEAEEVEEREEMKKRDDAREWQVIAELDDKVDQHIEW